MWKKMERQTAIAILLGFIVMILFAGLTINLMGLIPILSPLFGGIVAGYWSGKGYVHGAAAGLWAGVFGTIAVLADFYAQTGYLKEAIPYLPQLEGEAFLLLGMVICFLILAFIGGAIGGAIHRAPPEAKKE